MVMADGPRHLQRGPVRVGFYDIEGTLGKGNFAVVKLGRHRITKTEVRHHRGSAGAWRGCALGGGRRAWHCGDLGVQLGGGGLSLGSHTGFRSESPTRGPGLWPRLPSPKFRVFPAFGWGWGGRGSLGAPGPRGDQRRRREKGTDRQFPDLADAERGPTRSPSLLGEEGVPRTRPVRTDRCPFSLLWARRVSDWVPAWLDLLPEIYLILQTIELVKNGHRGSAQSSGVGCPFIRCAFWLQSTHSLSHISLTTQKALNCSLSVTPASPLHGTS